MKSIHIRRSFLIKLISHITTIFLFLIGYLRIINTLPSNFIIKTVFTLTYVWFTIGINANLLIPLINNINKIID